MTDYTIAAIPTVYRGRRYRSRLEARWAAFFDLLGWRHEYEPFDLGAWSPDFLIRSHNDVPILIEVKPITRYDPETALRMYRAARDRNLRCSPVLVGVSPHFEHAQLGWSLPYPLGFMLDEDLAKDEAATFRAFADEAGPVWDFSPDFVGHGEGELTGYTSHYHPNVFKQFPGSFTAYRTDLLEHITERERYIAVLRTMWAEATNAAQWQPGAAS